MITSETDLCNLALAHLGQAPIVSLDENEASARACRLHYKSTRDGTLRAHRWNFAAKRAVLSELDEAPLFGWDRAFQLPEDFVRLMEFNDSEAGDLISEEYVIEGRKLLTNATEARLVYVRRVEDVTLFDPLFVEALAIKLAVKLSETIRGTTAKTEELMQAYERVVAPIARRTDANEGRRRRGLLSLNSHFVRARGASGPAHLAGGVVVIEADGVAEHDHEVIDGGAP